MDSDDSAWFEDSDYATRDYSATVDGDDSAWFEDGESATIDGDGSAWFEDGDSATRDYSATMDGDDSAWFEDGESAPMDGDRSAWFEDGDSATRDYSATMAGDDSAWFEDGTDYYGYSTHSTYSFEQAYRCYPIIGVDKYAHLESGNKIIMPLSALDSLLDMKIQYPMLFELKNASTGRISHCGVMEFDSDEGEILLPNWMMQNMKLEEGELVILTNASLQKGNYIKLQPHTKDFLEISNPKTVLEKTLRNFSCITVGDTIMVLYNNKKFYIDILEAKPSFAICVIDIDCVVDFAAPLDYKEADSEKPKNIEKSVEKKEEEVKFKPFSGAARRLDELPAETVVSALDCAPVVKEEQVEQKQFQPFSGKSYKLIEDLTLNALDINE